MGMKCCSKYSNTLVNTVYFMEQNCISKTVYFELHAALAILDFLTRKLLRNIPERIEKIWMKYLLFKRKKTLKTFILTFTDFSE